MGNTTELDHVEDEAWRAFISAHGQITRSLDQQLSEAHQMTLAEYEVLLHLSEADDRQLRMNELADLCGLSPSGLTRRFDSMVRSGLVEREKCDDDRRGVFAVLTDHGLARLEEAKPTHLAGVRRVFVDPLDRSELETIAAAFDRIAPRPRSARTTSVGTA